MYCDVLSINGRPAIVCRSGRRPTCKFCKHRSAVKYCDAPIGRGRTCDAPMCAECAKSVGFNKDVCPDHHYVSIQLPLPGGQAE